MARARRYFQAVNDEHRPMILPIRLGQMSAKRPRPFLLALVLAGACQSTPHAPPSVAMAPGAGVVSAGSAAAIAAADKAAAQFAPADVEFMQGMIPHHAQAVIMARWARDARRARRRQDPLPAHRDRADRRDPHDAPLARRPESGRARFHVDAPRHEDGRHGARDADAGHAHRRADAGTRSSARLARSTACSSPA